MGGGAGGRGAITQEHRWLVLRLEAPLLAFGGVAIDAVGPTRDFPAASALTGLIANALGWNRTDAEAHQALRDRLIFAAHLEKNDRGWTTRGYAEGRDGASYGAPHRRQRDYHADASVTVVLRLARPDDAPTLDDIGAGAPLGFDAFARHRPDHRRPPPARPPPIFEHSHRSDLAVGRPLGVSQNSGPSTLGSGYNNGNANKRCIAVYASPSASAA